MEKTAKTSTLTTIGIDRQTNKLIEKLCKRYSLKKGEIVKLAFGYLDKACINPAEAPESVKSELSKINKRQDDLIRFIRHYEEEQLNPMIRATNSIATRFDSIAKYLEAVILSQLEKSKIEQENSLEIINEQFKKQMELITSQDKYVRAIYNVQQRDNQKLLTLINLYAELSSCGMMENKKKETLKAEIQRIINSK